jgi:hypothetical protein
LKHCAANRKRRLLTLPNVGPYIYTTLKFLALQGDPYTRIYDISRLRVKLDIPSNTNHCTAVIYIYIYTVKPRLTNNSVHEQVVRAKTSRMTNGVSDYEHASWQQRQAESICAGVSVAG